MAHLSQRLKPSKLLLSIVAVVLLLAGMVAGTTFVDTTEATDVRGLDFDPQEYTDQAFPEIRDMIVERAVPLPLLAESIASDPAAAGAEFGQDMGAGRYTYAVSVTGTVDDVDEEYLYLSVPELPDADVRVPLGSALSGNPVRDATGTIAFGDFPDQNSYQSVANFFRRKMLAEVIEPVDPPSLVGETLGLYAGWVTGGPADTYLLMPVMMEVVS